MDLGSGFAAKSKKGMLKKLGLADDKLKQEMSYEFLHSSDLENEVSKKISKLPKKVSSSSIRYLIYSQLSLHFLIFSLFTFNSSFSLYLSHLSEFERH